MNQYAGSKPGSVSPTVSIELITYNRPSLLRRAIQSVLDQTFTDFELIIVDDGSTRNTKRVVEEFTDTRISYVQHPVNRGGAAARNTGLKCAQGCYMAFIDDDDEWLPHKLELQLDKFGDVNDDVGLIYCWSNYLANGRVTKRHTPSRRGYILKDMLVGNRIGNASTILVRMDVFDRVGLFDEHKSRGIDSDFIRRLSKHYEVDVVDKVLVNVYEDDPSRTTPIMDKEDHKRCIREMLYLLDKFEEEFERYPQAKARRYIRIAYHWHQIHGLTNDSHAKTKARAFVRSAWAINFTPRIIFLSLATIFPFLTKLYLRVKRLFGIRKMRSSESFQHNANAEP